MAVQNELSRVGEEVLALLEVQPGEVPTLQQADGRIRCAAELVLDRIATGWVVLVRRRDISVGRVKMCILPVRPGCTTHAGIYPDIDFALTATGEGKSLVCTFHDSTRGSIFRGDITLNNGAIVVGEYAAYLRLMRSEACDLAAEILRVMQ